MSEMQESETIERFVEGLKRAASRARELAAMQKNDTWYTVATSLDNLRISGTKIFRGRALTRQDALKMLDDRVKDTKVN